MNLHLLRLLFACCLLGQSPGAAEIPEFTADGFRVPQPGPVFTFPRDHGSHPDYKIEWWYLTGHLFTDEPTPRRFGFQATFFRSAAPLEVAARPAPPAFGHSQIYLAHMALVDIATGRFLHQERLNRSGWDAGASTETLDVWNGDWSLRMVDAERQIMELTGGIHAEARFTFTLTPGKPLVRFGADGYSRKGSAPTAASYYLTFSRLSVDGRLRLGAEAPLSVSGQAWMDHEYSSSQLDPEQVGWDWLSAQFHDGRELMFYALRRRDGSIDPASTLTWIDRDGGTSRADYRWEAIDHWTSPATGATYPSRIRLTTTDPLNGRETVLLVVPFHRDQEIPGDLGGVTYWEGACRILAVDGETELGSAYLELTGYDRPVDVVR